MRGRNEKASINDAKVKLPWSPCIQKNVLTLVMIVLLTFLGMRAPHLYLDEQRSEQKFNRDTESIANQHLFHSRYRRKVLSVVNASTILDWKPRSDEEFEVFVDQFRSLPEYIHFEKNDEARRTRFWKNETHRSLIYYPHRNICTIVEKFQEGGSVKQHVLLSQFNENWGLFSSSVPNRTAPWGDIEKYLVERGCTLEEVVAYLDNSNTLAVITVQHQYFSHPKVHSIPLGVLYKEELLSAMYKPLVNRSQLLMINSSPTKLRDAQIETVLSNFKETGVTNSYGESLENYYMELRRSKFIACPSGLGWDTYRIWEALYLGTIPVIERYHRQDGWHRTLDNLPIVWVESFQDSAFNESYLWKEYKKVTNHLEFFEIEKLTKCYWKKLVLSYL